MPHHHPEPMPGADARSVALLPGQRVGPYTLIEAIGEGGMGTVYRAEQTEPVRRSVALKVIKPGMDTHQVIARFEAERQALAVMDHPNIARVFEAGSTSEGRPYFVMELVQGIPITDYCDANQLSLGDRLGLFVMVCRAVQHAHQKGVIHRDLKPSNILVTVHDGAPVPKIIDFGIAKATGWQLTEQTLATGLGQFLGTPLYMSPEQADPSRQDVDTRSDIYSLGVLLYEMLTGSTPFDRETFRTAAVEEIRRILRDEDPPRPSTRLNTLGPMADAVSANRGSDPRKLSRSLRRELDWIVMKALEKEPNRRYEAAGAFAEDLARYLAGEPVEAHPPSSWYRTQKFARRNRAFLLTATLVATSLIAGTVVSAWQASQARWAERKAIAAERSSRYESYINQLQRLMTSPHQSGWSDEAERLAHQATLLGRDDEGRLQGLAAAALTGLEARESERFDDFGADNLLFDPSGVRLLLGGVSDPANGIGGGWNARIWNDAVRKLEELPSAGTGPVAFLPGGTPVQLRAEARVANGPNDRDGSALELRDLSTGRLLTRYLWAAPGNSGVILATSATPDASRVSAVIGPRGSGSALVWDGPSGRKLAEIPGDFSAVTLSADGRLLALGEETGRVVVRSIDSGEQIASFRAAKARVESLAIQRPKNPAGLDPDHAITGDLIAVGLEGGTISIWDVETSTIRSWSRGVNGTLSTLTFSPDGMILASSGRSRAQLWDVATGEHLLNIDGGNYVLGLAFSPDSRRLAVGGKAAHGGRGHVALWDLENGRGVETLRGLTTWVKQTIVSRDGRRVAALSQDWRVGVWDRASGRLLHVFDVPPGLFPDNAGMAFDPEGRRFAFAARNAAKLWDLQTGRELGSWKLPEGLQDTLAFRGDDELLSARVETIDGRDGPYKEVDRDRHPRICQVRNLLGPRPTEPIAHIDTFNRHVFAARGTADGEYLVVNGLGGSSENPSRSLEAYHWATAKRLWSIPCNLKHDGALFIDPTGKALCAYYPGTFPAPTLLEVASGKRLSTVAPLRGSDPEPGALGPGASRWATHGRALGEIELWDSAWPGPILHLIHDAAGEPPDRYEFSRDGKTLVAGRSDGLVHVYDLERMQSRLLNLALGWEK